MLPAIALYAGITAKVVQQPLNHRGEPGGDWLASPLALIALQEGQQVSHLLST